MQRLPRPAQEGRRRGDEGQPGREDESEVPGSRGRHQRDGTRRVQALRRRTPRQDQGAPGQGGEGRRPRLPPRRVLRARPRSFRSRPRPPTLRRAAHRRHDPPRGPDRGDAHRRG